MFSTNPQELHRRIDARAEQIAADVISWRRHLHQYPELSNREVETARFVAERLREFGLSPRTGIAGHGVVALIEGQLPGPAIALRADMDALPVREEVDLPFASRATGIYRGQVVPVMHACGHDAHTAMLLGAARVLAELRAELPGTIVLIFQPAEEGVPPEERPAGAEAMVAAGVLVDPPVEAIFGLHVFAPMPSGLVGYRSGPMLAAADRFEIEVRGRQAHGSTPWLGIDPIVVASQIVSSLQTLVSRRIELTREPAVVTVGRFESGIRNNILPDRAVLEGTIRTFDEGMRQQIHRELTVLAESVARAHGAEAQVLIEPGYPVTANDPHLLARMMSTLERVTSNRLTEVRKFTGAEDFSFYARKVPGLFLALGITPTEMLATAASNHSPQFFVDESALATGVRLLSHLAVDYLRGNNRSLEHSPNLSSKL